MLENKPIEERRIFARIPVELPVRLLSLDNQREAVATTCDVSAQGLGIVSKEPLSFNDALEVWLDMPDKKEPFYAQGRVAWRQVSTAGLYRLGVRLDQVDFMGMSRIFRGNFVAF